MPARDWFRPPRQVVTAFIAVAVVSAIALGGLTWYVLDQDRELEATRVRDRLDLAADRAVASMERALLDLDAVAGATSDEQTRPPGVIGITITADGLSAQPNPPLRFQPTVAAEEGASNPADAFAEGERLEYVDRDLLGAARSYGAQKASADIATRAGALLRLARVERKRGEFEKALRTYDALAAYDAVVVDGIPAGTAVRLGRITTLTDINRPENRQLEAEALLTDLYAGRWRISRGMYESYTAEARRWLTTPPDDDHEAVALAKAVEWLWSSRAGLGARGRRVVTFDEGPALVTWRMPTRGSGELTAAVAGRAHLQAMAAAAFAPDVRWSLVDVDGRSVLGDRGQADVIVERAASTVGLPWSIRVSVRPGEQTSSSRTPLIMVLGVVALVVAAGWHFVFRSLRRERQVAALQSNFVAAVSHEFRSPLTALAHAADLLSTDRLPSQLLRRRAYDVLTRETARLRGLVDGLLDSERFGKGAAAFRFEPVSIDALVGDTISAFRAYVASAGYSVELAGNAGGAVLRGDREALSRALWNLLDNAVKYSPACKTVWVEVSSGTDRISITVRDQGIGIPIGEQRAIFERFVRGAVATSERIRGTGLGLALVRQIVEAHGGDVGVSSEPGRGSRFTLVLMTAARVQMEAIGVGSLRDQNGGTFHA